MITCKMYKKKIKIDHKKFSDDLNLLIQNIDFMNFNIIINSIESNADLLYLNNTDSLVKLEHENLFLEFFSNSNEIKNILCLKFKRKNDLFISYWRTLRQNIIKEFQKINSLPNRLSYKTLTNCFLQENKILNKNIQDIFLTNKISLKHISIISKCEKFMNICKKYTNKKLFIDQIKKKIIDQFTLFFNQTNNLPYNLDLVVKNNIKFPCNINELINSFTFFYQKNCLKKKSWIN